jgi:hypothetical protein
VNPVLSYHSTFPYASNHEMNNVKNVLLITLLFYCSVSYSQVPITHSFFIAGPQFTGIIGEQGEEIWNAGRPAARDGYVLADGNILICWADQVVEYGKNKQVVFTYNRSTADMELGTAVRLKNGRTLITESGKNPRLVEVDKNGNIRVSVPLQPETDNVHMQTRMARKLPNGNYLVPHLLAFAVKEYKPTGEVVNIFRTDTPELGSRDSVNWPFTAIRLDNGNTLVSLTHGNKIVEFNPSGGVEWKVTNNDFKDRPFQDPCGVQRLPNGNTVIASYGAKKGIKLFEITPSKEMVWHYDVYGAHEFQILTTNGVPIAEEPLK